MTQSTRAVTFDEPQKLRLVRVVRPKKELILAVDGDVRWRLENNTLYKNMNVFILDVYNYLFSLHCRLAELAERATSVNLGFNRLTILPEQIGIFQKLTDLDLRYTLSVAVLLHLLGTLPSNVCLVYIDPSSHQL